MAAMKLSMPPGSCSTGIHIILEELAVIFPDGVARWYIRGKEMTRAVNMFFFRNKWPPQRGLDTPEKIARFQGEFLN